MVNPPCQFVIPSFILRQATLPNAQRDKEQSNGNGAQNHGRNTEIGIGEQPHAVRRLHSEVHIQSIDRNAAEYEAAQASTQAYHVENPDTDKPAHQHIKAAKQHGGVAQKALQNIVIRKGGRIIEIGIQHNAKHAAHCSRIEAKLAQKLKQQTLLVTTAGCDQKHPHNHIAGIDRENVIILQCSASS